MMKQAFERIAGAVAARLLKRGVFAVVCRRSVLLRVCLCRSYWEAWETAENGRFWRVSGVYYLNGREAVKVRI